MRRVLPGVGLALGVLCLAIVVRMLPTYYIGLLTEALILGIFAMSLNLLMGHTGIPSLGHAAYFGVGAYPGADFEVLLLALVVVIIGGLGSMRGAFVGSLVVGLLDTFGRALVPELAMFTIFAPMAIILAVKPTGLFGRE